VPSHMFELKNSFIEPKKINFFLTLITLFALSEGNNCGWVYNNMMQFSLFHQSEGKNDFLYFLWMFGSEIKQLLPPPIISKKLSFTMMNFVMIRSTVDVMHQEHFTKKPILLLFALLLVGEFRTLFFRVKTVNLWTKSASKEIIALALFRAT
jgi:hypothetical protein